MACHIVSVCLFRVLKPTGHGVVTFHRPLHVIVPGVALIGAIFLGVRYLGWTW